MKERSYKKIMFHGTKSASKTPYQLCSWKYRPKSVSWSNHDDGVPSQNLVTIKNPSPDFGPFHSEEILVREAWKVSTVSLS